MNFLTEAMAASTSQIDGEIAICKEKRSFLMKLRKIAERREALNTVISQDVNSQINPSKTNPIQANLVLPSEEFGNGEHEDEGEDEVPFDEDDVIVPMEPVQPQRPARRVTRSVPAIDGF